MGQNGSWLSIEGAKMTATLNRHFYVGEFQHTLDTKHRLTIPAKWRCAGDGEDVYLALPNPIGCITVYPPAMVAKLEAKVAEVSLGNQKGQKALVKLFSQADTFTCDRNGRVGVGEKLIVHADIRETVMLVGSYVTFGIWNLERYQKYLSNDVEVEDPLSVILKDLGL